MTTLEWWKPDKFDVVDSASNTSLTGVREKVAGSSQLRAQYSKARNRCSRSLVEIPVVVRPNGKDGIDEGEVLIIGDVVSWPEGLAEKILHGELRVVTATFRGQPKRARDKINRIQRFRRHSHMQISIQQSETQGERPMMEDRYVIHLFNDIAVFGVFDGHGGSGAADFVAERLVPTLRAELENALGQGRTLSFTESNPQPPDAIEEETVELLKQSLLNTIAQVERDALQHLIATNDYSGTTLCVCLCTRSTLIAASLGDSRVYVSRNGVPKQVTKRDHSAREDEERIKKDGGFVNGEGYLMGLVQVSRAIGDVNPSTLAKIVGLSAEPDLIVFPLEKEKDEFILVACDGLWEVMSGQGAVGHVRSTLKTTNGDLLKAADGIVERALEQKNLGQCNSSYRILARCGSDLDQTRSDPSIG